MAVKTANLKHKLKI